MEKGTSEVWWLFNQAGESRRIRQYRGHPHPPFFSGMDDNVEGQEVILQAEAGYGGLVSYDN